MKCSVCDDTLRTPQETYIIRPIGPTCQRCAQWHLMGILLERKQLVCQLKDQPDGRHIIFKTTILD